MPLYKSRHRAEIRQLSSGNSPRRWAFIPRKYGTCTLRGHFGTTPIDPRRGLPRQLEHNDKSLRVQEAIQVPHRPGKGEPAHLRKISHDDTSAAVQILYVQVLVAITIGILLGHYYPETGVALKPLGTASSN